VKKFLALLFCAASVGMCIIGSMPVRAQDIPQPTPFYGAGNPTPMGEGCYNGGQPPLCEDPAPANAAPSAPAVDTGNTSSNSSSGSGNAAVQATPVPGPMVCATVAVKVRSEPTTKSKQVGSLAKNKCLPAAGDMANGFYPVLINGGTGFVSRFYSKIVK
jgi:hypothetical protein